MEKKAPKAVEIIKGKPSVSNIQTGSTGYVTTIPPKASPTPTTSA